MRFRHSSNPARVEKRFAEKPPLKWAGGKRWLVPYLRSLWEPYKEQRLVEPLCGGLSVALGLSPSRALLNDVNVHAINFFRWLKRGLIITIRMENNQRVYYAHRKRFNEIVKDGGSESKEAAEIFYYLNRTCYNGLCRFNLSGEFNVPFGQYKRPRYIRDFTAYKRVFRHWKFSVGDFGKVQLLPSDFLYADPPYDVEFTEYSSGGFSWDDQVRLARWLLRHSGPVVLCNQATPRVCALYNDLGFELRFFDAPRLISCKGDRKRVKEVVALKGCYGK